MSNYCSCHFWQNFQLNWNRRRYVWRFAWIYSKLFWCLLIATACTLGLYVATKPSACTSYQSCGYFVNYECTPQSLQFITVSMMVVSGFWLAQGILCYIEARLLRIFMNYTINEFIKAGVWSGRIVFATNMIQYVISAIHYAWLIFNIVNIILVAFVGICSHRFDDRGVLGVKTCRLYFARCCTDNSCGSARVSYKDRNSCNSLSFLTRNNFLNDPKEFQLDEICKIPDGGLNSGGIDLLAAHQNITRHFELPFIEASPFPHFDYETGQHPLIKGILETLATESNAPTTIDTSVFIVNGGLSDMYRTIRLWAVGTVLFFLLFHVVFQLVKAVTPMETYLYMAADKDQPLYMKVLIFFTPSSS